MAIFQRFRYEDAGEQAFHQTAADTAGLGAASDAAARQLMTIRARALPIFGVT